MRPLYSELGMHLPYEQTFEMGGGRVEGKEAQPLQGTLGVVTGTSRGIGAEIAVSLAEAGVDIIGNHVDPTKERRQEGTQTRVEEHGVTFDSVLADVTTTQGREAILLQAIGDKDTPRKIDYLVLNAAGGLESKKPETWAKDFNIDSQHELINLFTPYMSDKAKIIYLTSLWAHQYGQLKQLPAYGPVASTKYQFEQELRERIPDLQEKGIDVGIIVGHVISGTSAHTLFTRNATEEMALLEPMAEGGKFPQASDMGKAVKELLIKGFTSGETVYVGGQQAEINDIPQQLNREQIANLLSMYSDEKLLIDTFERLEPGKGRATYQVRETDTEGHFTGEFGDIHIFRGVDQIEAMAQALGLSVLATEADTRALGVFRGIREGVTFDNPLEPGMTAEVYTNVTIRSREGFVGDAYMVAKNKTGDDIIVSTVKGIDIALMPNETTARKILGAKFAQYET